MTVSRSYTVVVTQEAEQDLRSAYRFIRQRAPQASRRWIQGVRAAIKKLAHNPESYPLAPESGYLGDSVRESFYGKGNRGTYRILFIIFSNFVYVLHVRHGSMLPLGDDD